jgi:hypothetical protein
MEPQNTPGNHGASGARPEKMSPDLAHAVAVGYEPHDIALRGVFIFLVSLAVISVVVLIIVWAGMMGFVKFDRQFDPTASPVVIKPETPSEPLQPSWNHNSFDREDMQAMREETQRILSSTGTSPTGRRYIDIDSAMAQVLPQLPVRQAVEPGSGGGSQ